MTQTGPNLGHERLEGPIDERVTLGARAPDDDLAESRHQRPRRREREQVEREEERAAMLVHGNVLLVRGRDRRRVHRPVHERIDRARVLPRLSHWQKHGQQTSRDERAAAAEHVRWRRPPQDAQ